MSITQDDVLLKQKNKRRVFFLIISRIVIITIILSITVYIDFRKQLFAVQDVTIYYFYFIVTVIYLFSIVYSILHKLKVHYKKNIFLQIAVDILAVTSLIFMFGNTQIDYSLFYTLIIIYSAVFLGRKGSIFVA